jgi:serpin B
MKRLLLAIGVAATLIACNNEENPKPNERRDIILSANEEVLSDDCVDFAFRFFKQTQKKEAKQKNWMISPLSLTYALSMTANGADEKTLDEIRTTLGFGDIAMEEINLYNKKLVDQLKTLDNTAKFNSANSIWTDDSITLLDDFINTNRQMYDAEVSNIDASSDECKKTINNWCAQKTDNCIPEIYPQEESLDFNVLLINAIYFNGKWNGKFEVSETQEPFYNANGTTTQTNMMNMKKELKYDENDKFRLVEIPYGNGAFSMVIMLPQHGVELDEAIDYINSSRWSNIVDSESFASTVKTNVKMPRFEITYKESLVNSLMAMGVKEAFTTNANFSKISDTSLFITDIIQSTTLKVNEKGSLAAATTVVNMGITSPSPTPKEVTFNVNKPFMFVIKEQSTNTFIFMGKMTHL